MFNPSETVNVASLLAIAAQNDPDGMAIAEPLGRDSRGQQRYRQITFRELDHDSLVLAAALSRLGVRPGMRIVLMVRPSINFIALVFALFKAGIVTVLIDPGMGRRNAIRCLEQVEPEGFIASARKGEIPIDVPFQFTFVKSGKCRLIVTAVRPYPEKSTTKTLALDIINPFRIFLDPVHSGTVLRFTLQDTTSSDIDTAHLSVKCTTQIRFSTTGNQ